MGKLRFETLVSGTPIQFASVGPVDPTRFKQVFVDTWGRLQQIVRSILIGSWQRVGRCDVYHVNAWKGVDTQLAQCTANGAVLRFLSPSVALMPQPVLACCIVHELAHSFFFAIDDPYHCNSELPENIRRRLAEALVKEMASIWGYPDSILEKWCAENLAALEANATTARSIAIK